MFGAVKLLSEILQIHALMHLSKHIGCTIPRMNHSVNYGLRVIMMYQCIVINYDKCTTLVGDTDNSGGRARVGTEIRWKTSIPSAQFCHEPKIAQKIKIRLGNLSRGTNYNSVFSHDEICSRISVLLWIR